MISGLPHPIMPASRLNDNRAGMTLTAGLVADVCCKNAPTVDDIILYIIVVINREIRLIHSPLMTERFFQEGGKSQINIAAI